MEALGRLFDVVAGVVPADPVGTATGFRVRLRDADGLTVVAFAGTGTAAEAPTFTLREHDSDTGGTSQDLAVIDRYYEKVATSLDGSETWTEVEQTASADVTDADWDDANEIVVVFEVEAASLSDGFDWASVNIASADTAHPGCLLYLLRDLKVQRHPDELAAPQ